MKHYSPKQKANIALAALKGEKISSLASQYEIHPHQITRWKNLVEAEVESLFTDKRKKDNYSKDRIIDELYKTIGQREVEISWLKKNSTLSCREKSALADRNSGITIIRQAELLGISRSSLYYEPRINEEDILIMNAIDEIYTNCPFYGHRRVIPELREDYH